MSQSTAILATPRLPKDWDGPVFAEPWQAQAFALTVKLHEAGHFTWAEWVEYLSREIAAPDPADAADAETTYYLQWLAALEKLSAAKGLASSAEISARKGEWRAAYEDTPFGQPVVRGDHHDDHDHGHGPHEH